MSVPTFASLLSEHLTRAGISDTELARSIGVRRQTVFRWKEGLVERPRARDDVLRCARKLRLTTEERDLLLLAAGFAPEELSTEMLRDSLSEQSAPAKAETDSGQDIAAAEEDVDRDTALVAERLPSSVMPDEWGSAGGDTEGQDSGNDSTFSGDNLQGDVSSAKTDRPVIQPPAEAQDGRLAPPSVETAVPSLSHVSPTTAPELASLEALSVETDPEPEGQFVVDLFRRYGRYTILVPLALLVLVVLLVWRIFPVVEQPVEPVATEPAVQVTLNPPKPTATADFPLIFPKVILSETLLIVAPFDGYTVNEQYNVAGRIRDALQAEIANIGLISTTIEIWPEKIRNPAYLERMLADSQATLVIWGEYDSGRVRVNLNGINDLAQQRDFVLSSPDELITTITNTLPKEIQLLALITLGRLLRSQGNDAIAVVALERALDLNPGDPKTRALINFYLGNLAEGTGDARALSRALRYYENAFTDNPNLYDAQYNLGTLYLKRAYSYAKDDPKIVADLTSAIDHLSELIGVRPSSKLAHLNRGIARYERRQGTDLADASADFSYIIAVDREDYSAYFHRALVGIRSGESMRWVSDLEETLRLAPGYAQAYNGLCWGYALAQEPENALPYCDLAVAQDVTASSYDSRAIVYAQLERFAEAAADFTAYITWLKDAKEPKLYGRYRGPETEAWIDAVNQGENPFTTAVLADLR